MKIDVTKPLVTMDGQTMKDADGQGNAIDATFRLAIVNALLVPKQSDKGVDKVRKYELAKRIFQNDEVDLNDKEIVEIKDCVGENFAPIVVGQVFDLLRV